MHTFYDKIIYHKQIRTTDNIEKEQLWMFEWNTNGDVHKWQEFEESRTDVLLY